MPALLLYGRYPARNVGQSIPDPQAQIAGNEKSLDELRNRAEHVGRDNVHAYMGHVQDNAEKAVRRV